MSAWYFNGSSGVLNNNNNKYNPRQCRAACALGEDEYSGWMDAYFDCIANKRTSAQCDRYRAVDVEDDLLRLMHEVKERSYEPGVSLCFIVTRPRLREIFAASFRDRIVQHWITLRINPLLEQRFQEQGDVSFNCRKGYGSHRAVLRLQDDIEQVSEHYSRETWVGKMDIKAFFMSIDKEVLLGQLLPFIRERYHGDDLNTLLWLTEVTIRHCPQHLCRRGGCLALWDRLPKGKSLFDNPDGKGMAIGNITSQILANFYLSFFDDWMLEQCHGVGARYVRFVDDFCIVCTDKRFIVELHKRASVWLQEHLLLTLHPDKFYLQEVRKGVKFVGQVVKPGRRYTANTTVSKYYDRLMQLESLCKAIAEKGINHRRAVLLDRMAASLNSYNGFLKHSASYNIKRDTFDKLKYYWHCCYVSGRHEVVKIKKEYKLSTILKQELT